VDKLIIDPGEFTQTRGVQKIISLNRKWNPRFIYVDKGHGTTQIEQLHLFGIQTPTSGLHKKVKGIDMASKTEIKDPTTKRFGMMVDKENKHLMVELSARQLEEGRCLFPRSEDVKSGLVTQLRNYEIIRWSSAGKPVYTKDDEHTAVAWMLSIYAFVLEFTDIRKIRLSTRMAATPDFGRSKVPSRTGFQEPEDTREPVDTDRPLRHVKGAYTSMNFLKSRVEDRRRPKRETFGNRGRKSSRRSNF